MAGTSNTQTKHVKVGAVWYRRKRDSRPGSRKRWVGSHGERERFLNEMGQNQDLEVVQN